MYVSLLQAEEKLLVMVEGVQNELSKLKNQLLSKKSQVATAKAELEQKIHSLKGINK